MELKTRDYTLPHLLGRHEGTLEERCAGGYNLRNVYLWIEWKWYRLELGEVHLELLWIGEKFLKLFSLLVTISRLLGHQLDQLNQFVNEALLIAKVV